MQILRLFVNDSLVLWSFFWHLSLQEAAKLLERSAAHARSFKCESWRAVFRTFNST